MSTESQILALFEEGNPVPDIDELDTFDIDAAAYLAALRAGSRKVTKVENKIEKPEQKRPPLVWLVAAAAVLVVAVGSIALLRAGDDTESAPVASEPNTPEVLTPEMLPGNEYLVIGGRNQDLPTRLILNADGTFAVEDGGFDVDNGTYTIAGDQISFTSEWVEGRGPMDYGVIWARPACPECNANPIMRTDKCEGVVGDYTLLFETPGTFSFRVINDECLLRTYVANGMELRLSASG